MVPNLRFLQFTDEWSKFAVSELLNTYPTNSLSWDKLSYIEKSKIKNIHYGLIHNGFKSTIISGNNQFIPFVNNSFIPKSYTLLQNGDLILADASEDRKDVGRPVEMMNVNNQKIISGLHTIHARNKTNLLINGFKGFYFQSYAMKKQIYKVANGSKIYGISPSSFNELFISVPNKEEQQKIVNLLQKIEGRIETQSKIIELKKSIIKKIEETIFWCSSINNLVPVSLFLDEINEKSQIQNLYPILSSTKKGLFLQSEYFNKEAASSNNIGYKIVHKENVIISPQNLWMGNITYNNKFENGLVSPSYRVFKIKGQYNPIYVSHLLMTYRAVSMYKTISEQGASIVRRNLNIDAFNELLFPLPNRKKQDEVSCLIGKLHQDLVNEQQILNLLNKQKKFLLANMFI